MMLVPITLLLTILWPALLASLALGLAAGWLTGPPRSRPTRIAALGLIATAIAVAALALAGLVPGRAGFWVESAALNLGTYCLGAAGGALATLARPALRS